MSGVREHPLQPLHEDKDPAGLVNDQPQ
jgi:hypothetical protein